MSAHERRTHLVAAAIRVLARDGVAGTTTRAIVGEAGMPLGVFHYCFRSKDELLVAVIETINDRHLRTIMEVVEPHSSLRATLDAGLQAYWEQVQRNRGDYQLAYELTQYALRQPGLADVTRRRYQQCIEVASRFLTAAADGARVDWTIPLPLLARYVHNVIDGATLAWIVDGDRAAALAVIDQLVEHLAGLGRRRAAWASA
jgi:AcrR family transcriptional regulator